MQYHGNGAYLASTDKINLLCRIITFGIAGHGTA